MSQKFYPLSRFSEYSLNKTSILSHCFFVFNKMLKEKQYFMKNMLQQNFLKHCLYNINIKLLPVLPKPTIKLPKKVRLAIEMKINIWKRKHSWLERAVAIMYLPITLESNFSVIKRVPNPTSILLELRTILRGTVPLIRTHLSTKSRF